MSGYLNADKSGHCWKDNNLLSHQPGEGTEVVGTLGSGWVWSTTTLSTPTHTSTTLRKAIILHIFLKI